MFDQVKSRSVRGRLSELSVRVPSGTGVSSSVFYRIQRHKTDVDRLALWFAHRTTKAYVDLPFISLFGIS